MKKILFGCLSIVLLSSCNVKNSDEYKALQAERDSIMAANKSAEAENSEMSEMIKEIDDNFARIKEAEKFLTIESNTTGEMTRDTKTRVADNFSMINQILTKNKADIEALNKKLKASGNQSSQLKQTIERLTAELNDRSNTIIELQKSLASRDEQIANLTVAVEKLNVNVEDLSNKNIEQEGKIKEQEKALNTAYYIFGTAKELKEAKVLSGGFLASNKILNESIDKSIFIKIDIRKTLQIPVYAKKAKLLSNQPQDSYSIEKNSNGQAVIKISDYKRFWSLGQFLIIQVD